MLVDMTELIERSEWTQVLLKYRRRCELAQRFDPVPGLRSLQRHFDDIRARLTSPRSAYDCVSYAPSLGFGATPPSLHIDEERKGKVMNLLRKLVGVASMHVPTGKLVADVQPIVARDALSGPRTIVLPSAKASRFGPGRQSAGKKTHQLTLRVSDEYRAYMDALRIEADAENLAQLVRWAVVMLEQALDDGFVIERSDGVMVGDRVVSRRNGFAKTARQGGTDDVLRVNVGLDAEQHVLFKRLSKRTGLGLVEMVATALGVLDAWLIDDASDTADPTAVNAIDAGDDDQVANATNHLVRSNAM